MRKRKNIIYQSIAAAQGTKQKDVFIDRIGDYTFYNSCRNNWKLGVGFEEKKEIASRVVDFQAASERLCKLRIRGRYEKSLINVHSETEDEKRKDI